MPRTDRKSKIEALSKVLGYPVITYVTCTRNGAAAQMNGDAVRYVFEHLQRIAPKEKIEKLALLIHSYGGDPGTSWRLMSLLREFANHVTVLVPYQAFSAATLLALGADEILMHPIAALGPTDPSIINPLNPKDSAGNLLPVSVEDVLSYIALVKEDVKINHEDELVQAFAKLVDQVHPLALGNVKRSHSQGKLIARKLMQLRGSALDDHKIKEIAENLTSKLYYHGHPINRVEATGLDLPVKDPTREVEKAMWDLYRDYERDMHLDVDFNAVFELATATPVSLGTPSPATTPMMPAGVPLPPGVVAAPAATPAGALPTVAAIAGPLSKTVKIDLVMVESEYRCDTFVNTLQLTGTRDPLAGVVGARTSLQHSGWITT